MWGLREQIKELRAALKEIYDMADSHWDGGITEEIAKIAKAALDKRA